MSGPALLLNIARISAYPPVASPERPPRSSRGWVGGQYLGRAPIGDAEGVLELLGLLLLAVRGQICSRQDLVVENLLLRHQLAVLTRPTRTRPRPHLRSWDKLVCLGARPRRLRGMARPPGASHAGHGSTPWGRKPHHLLRDRAAVYGRDFRARAERIGIAAIATPIRAPMANAVAERVIGTLRRQCLDHVIVLNEQHLSSVLAEIRPLLQHGAAPSDSASGDAGATSPSGPRPGAFAPSAQRSSPHLRACCLSTAEVLPPDSYAGERAQPRDRGDYACASVAGRR